MVVGAQRAHVVIKTILQLSHLLIEAVHLLVEGPDAEMGNKLANPVPSFDTASSHYSADELAVARSKFKSLCYSDQNIVRLENFLQLSSAPAILKKRLLPRLFEVMDSKKENLIEFESYFCTLSLLRRSNLDELSKFLFILYGTNKSTTMQRDGIRDLLIDSHAAHSSSPSMKLESIEKRIKSLQDLVEGMVDMVLLQYAVANPDRLTFAEFSAFVKSDDSIQYLISLLPECLCD